MVTRDHLYRVITKPSDQSIIKNHLRPFFGRLSFSTLKQVLMKNLLHN